MQCLKSAMTAETSIYQKRKARTAVRRAIDSGRLTRPKLCSRCNEEGSVFRDGRAAIHAHHHKGYDHPLDVEWLCQKCHFKEDKRLSKEANGNARLTESAVLAIRARYKPGAGGGRWRGSSPNGKCGLAREFSVSTRTIDRVLKNLNWVYDE